jgi:hypothetical protein
MRCVLPLVQVSTMTEAIVTRLPNRPGEISRLATLLAGANVNINAISVTAHGEQGTAYVLCDDMKNAKQALRKGGIEVETRTVFTKRLENRPGALAEFTERLGKDGVNIRELIGVAPMNEDEAEAYFDVDNADKARRHFQ